MGKKVNCAICKTSDDSLSYFRLPLSDGQRRNAWLEFMNCTGAKEIVTPSTRICQKHFSVDRFSKSEGMDFKKKRLKKTAVPNLLPPTREYVSSKSNNSCTYHHRYCYICGGIVNEDRTYHRFPKSITRQNEWLRRLGMKRRFSGSAMYHQRLCNKHFSPDDFVYTACTEKRHLRPNANPIKRGTSDYIAQDVLVIDMASSDSESSTVDDSTDNMNIDTIDDTINKTDDAANNRTNTTGDAIKNTADVTDDTTNETTDDSEILLPVLSFFGSYNSQTYISHSLFV